MEWLSDLEIYLWYAVDILLVVGVLAALTVAGIWLWHKWGRKAIKKPVTPPDPAVETMDRLALLLASIEPNTQEAEKKLMDAKVASENLMRQILVVVEKIEELEREAQHIAQVVEAIRGGKRDEIAYWAGHIRDKTLRPLLLSPYLESRDDLRTEAFVLLANERGTLEECAHGYGKLVSALAGQLAQARNRTIGLEAQVQMLEASHPILLIEKGLSESIDALNLRAQPALRWTAKQQLPSGIRGFLSS